MEERLNEIFNELQKEAYNPDYHTYDYKTTNQIIRKHFEKLVGQIEPLVRQGALSAGVACGKCDGCGNEKTYENQACMPINGKVRCIDWCIHQIVASLNAGGVETVACCCGHGEHVGRIDLADGRTLFISKPSA